MGLGGGEGAHMGGDEHVAGQEVAFHLHVQQLGSHGESSQSAVAVGDIANHLRTGTDGAQTAQDADGGGAAAGGLAAGAGDADLHHVGLAPGPNQGVGLHVGVGIDALEIGHHVGTGDGAAVQKVKDLDELFDKHSNSSLVLLRLGGGR